MRRIAWVAWRDFVATVTTKGFIISVLLPPILIGAMIYILPKLNIDAPPDIKGELAILDPTGEVAERVKKGLTREAIVRRSSEIR